MAVELTESQQYDLFFELARNLSHPSREVRLSAVFAISKIANRRCTNLLLDKLELESDIFIKASLIRILGQIGTPNLFEALEKYIYHPEPRIRANAVETMVKLKIKEKQRIVETLEVLVSDENNRVAATALKELIAMGERRYISLLKLMLKGTDPNRKSSAIWVIGELKLLELLEDVIYGLYSENYQVHSISSRVLGLFTNEAIPLLFENLNMKDPLVRVYSFLFLAKYLDKVSEEQKQILLSMAKEEDSVIRSFVLRILFQLHLPEGLELLQEAVFEEQETIRRVAVEGFQYYAGNEKAANLLLAAVEKEKSFALLASMIQALCFYPSATTVSQLQAFLSHEDPRVCANAIEVLGRIGDTCFLSMITPFLNSSNNRIMANAAVASFRLGEKKVLSHLRSALNDKTASMRASAAYALGEIGSREVLEILLEKLLDDTQQVRAQVIKGLMKQEGDVFSRLVESLKNVKTVNSRQALAEISLMAQIPEEGNVDLESVFHAYAQRIASFSVPDVLEPEERKRLLELVFSSEKSLSLYAIFCLGEHKVEEASSRLVCLLYSQDEEIVAEAILALKKLGSSSSLVFLVDIYGRLKGENISLCARVIQEFSPQPLGEKDFFRLSPSHILALKEALNLQADSEAQIFQGENQ